MDELFALFRALKDGEITEAQAVQAPVAFTILGLGRVECGEENPIRGLLSG